MHQFTKMEIDNNFRPINSIRYFSKYRRSQSMDFFQSNGGKDPKTFNGKFEYVQVFKFDVRRALNLNIC